MPVASITDKTSPHPKNYAETGQYVESLISGGKLNAVITKPSEDPASWIVRFEARTAGPLAQTEEQDCEALIEHTRKIKLLMERVREMDRKLSLTKEYIGDAKRKKKEGAKLEEAFSSNAPGPFHMDADEDMMSDR